MSITPIASTVQRHHFLAPSRTGSVALRLSSGDLFLYGAGTNQTTNNPDLTQNRPEIYSSGPNTWTLRAAASSTIFDYGGYYHDVAANQVVGTIARVSAGTSAVTAQYDVASDTWSALAAPPNSSLGRVDFAYWPTPDGRLWVVGGSTDSANGSNPLFDTMYYDRAANTWSVQSTTVPDRIFGSCLLPYFSPIRGVVLNAASTVVYTLGFNTGTFYSYTMATDTWTVLAAHPGSFTGGAHPPALLVGNLIYVSVNAFPTSSFYVYNITGNAWTTLTSPGSTVTALLSTGDGFVYAIDNGITGDTTHGHTHRYDPVANSWTNLTDVFQQIIGQVVSDGATAFYNLGQDANGHACDYWVPVSVPPVVAQPARLATIVG